MHFDIDYCQERKDFPSRLFASNFAFFAVSFVFQPTRVTNYKQPSILSLITANTHQLLLNEGEQHAKSHCRRSN